MPQNKQQAQIKIVIDHIRENLPDLIAIYIFGSWGSQYERTDSDIDIAVLADDPINTKKRVAIAQDIAQKLAKNVDLVDLKNTTTVMQSKIITESSRVYCVNLQSCESFEDFVYTSYARLNEERAGILEDILKRGSIYG